MNKINYLTPGAKNNKKKISYTLAVQFVLLEVEIAGVNEKKKYKRLAHMQLLSKASSMLPPSRRLCFFSPILALHLIVLAISGNVSAQSTTCELTKHRVGPFQPCWPGDPFTSSFSCQLRPSDCLNAFLHPQCQLSLPSWHLPQVEEDKKTKYKTN